MNELMKNGKVSRTRNRRRVEKLFRDGTVADETERYVTFCKDGAEETGKPVGGFPNLAGFCRWLHVGQAELHEIGEEYPASYDAMLTILEDEALCAVRGSSETARLMMVYLKRRLGYAEDGGEPVADATPLQVLFEHNILEDGK